jgi:hypothetical protein
MVWYKHCKKNVKFIVKILYLEFGLSTTVA